MFIHKEIDGEFGMDFLIFGDHVLVNVRTRTNPVRMQGFYVKDENISQILNYWYDTVWINSP